MLANLILATAFQILPFYQQAPERDFYAVRPFWAQEAETTDVLWPLCSFHSDWWRCCLFAHYQENREDGYQFEIMPLWWNGRTRATDEAYWGLFPIYGYHPHLLMMYDLEFALWPIWMRYRMPRPKDDAHDRRMTSNAVLFPFFHWREDGSWGFWPFYVTSHNRSDDHTTVLWPLWNWKTCFADRDTGGEGTAWMFWPLWGQVNRERETQYLFLPPFFSYVEVPDGWRGRYPLPLVEIERRADRSRTSVFPFCEHIENRHYYDGSPYDSIWRFGWRLVELLPGETRVFPFWVRRSDDAYFRLWPFWEREGNYSRFLSLLPIRWVPAVDRNWSKFWTFYERVADKGVNHHYLLWGIIRWTTKDDD